MSVIRHHMGWPPSPLPASCHHAGGATSSLPVIRTCGQRGRCPSHELVFLLPMSGSFLLVVHNSPATPAADEIRVQKRRAVSDAPEAWFLGCSFMDFFLVCYLKTLSTLAGRGRTEIAKTAAGFGIILGIKGWSCYGKRNRKSDSCVSAE